MTDIQQAVEGVCDLDYLEKACEAILFACGSAVSFDKIAISAGAGVGDIPPALKALKKKYIKMNSAIELCIMEGYAQFVTKSEYGEIVRTALELRKNQPLSRAALEVLAIIAYNQPVTRAFIDKVRGVESPSVVASLAEKGLIDEVGRLDAPGRPVLFGTTPVFLRTFGLSSIEDLVMLPELEELRRMFIKEDIQQEMDIGDGQIKNEGEELLSPNLLDDEQEETEETEETENNETENIQ